MTAAAGRGQPLLYLDFDGVLHPEDVWRHPKRGVYFGPAVRGHEFFEHALLLEELLEPYPCVRVVLSTSWVRVFGYMRAAKRLPDKLRARVVGATYHTAMRGAGFESMPRGYQVLADVTRRRPHEWVALDDDGQDWPEQHLGRLIRTDPMLGVNTEPSLAALKVWLTAISPSRSRSSSD